MDNFVGFFKKQLNVTFFHDYYAARCWCFILNSKVNLKHDIISLSQGQKSKGFDLPVLFLKYLTHSNTGWTCQGLIPLAQSLEMDFADSACFCIVS